MEQWDNGGRNMKVETSDTSKAVITFVSGLAVGIALLKTAKSRFARKAAVSAVAKGLQFKEDAQAALETIKEDAQDVLAEAKQKHSATQDAALPAAGNPESGVPAAGVQEGGTPGAGAE
jgi:hypothetical protein